MWAIVQPWLESIVNTVSKRNGNHTMRERPTETVDKDNAEKFFEETTGCRRLHKLAPFIPETESR